MRGRNGPQPDSASISGRAACFREFRLGDHCARTKRRTVVSSLPSIVMWPLVRARCGLGFALLTLALLVSALGPEVALAGSPAQATPPTGGGGGALLIPGGSASASVAGPCATYTVTVTYAGGPATLSGSGTAATPFAADDAYRVTVQQTGFTREFVSLTNDLPPVDISAGLQVGPNTIVAQAINILPPTCGGGFLYLLGVATGDTIPPTISDVTF